MQRVAFFRPGTHRSRSGHEVTLTGEDLAAAAAAYDPAVYAAPLVLGHPALDAPAYGRIGRLEYVEEAGLIYATDLQNLDADFSSWVEDGRYDTVSVSWYPPDHPDNPKPGTWYPRHLGFLGAHPPALKGLPAPEFADAVEGLVTLEFAEPPAAPAWALRRLAGLVRRFRDFIASERGAEEAEKIIPAADLDFIIEDVAREEGRHWEQERQAEQAGAHGFSEPTQPQPEEVMDPTQIAEREQALQQREAELKRQQEAFEQQRQQAEEAAAAARRAEYIEFAQGLTRDGGRIRPDEQVVVVETLCALDRLDRQAGTVTVVEFGEGDGAEQKPLIGEVKRLLGRLGPQVPGGEVAPDGERQAPRTEDFAAPSGYEVDAAAMDVHRKALAYQAEHKVDYVAAVRAVS